MSGPSRAETGRLVDSLLRDVPDFPEPGVVFKDITPLLADPDGFAAVVEGLAAAGRGGPGRSTAPWPRSASSCACPWPSDRSA